MIERSGGTSVDSGADLVVVGAGVMGAWIALRARREGWSTTLIDAFGAGHARATSGDETRIIRSSHSDDPFYSRWSREALTDWNDLADAIGERLFVPAGVLWLAHDEGGWEASSEATLRTEGIPVERLSPDDLAARWPQMRSDDLAFAIFEPEAGLLMARRGVAAVARTFAGEGGVFELGWAEPGRPTGVGCSTSGWAMAVVAPRPSSCSPLVRGCRVSSPTWSATSSG